MGCTGAYWIKKALFLLLILGLVASSIIHLVVSAQEPEDSYFTVNMTGVNQSYYVIGMAGVNASRLWVNTGVTVIELTGVRMYPISCHFGLVRPNAIRSTESEFAIRNATNVTVTVQIAVTGDWYGVTNWTHSDTCDVGVDTAGLVAVVNGSNGNDVVIVKKTTPYNTVAQNLTPGDHCQFSLELHAPTAFSDHTQKSNTIFITYSEVT